MSYVIIKLEPGKMLYWKHGVAGGWTEDLKEARLYAMEPSAENARRMLVKRPGMDPNIAVEYTIKR